MRIGGCVAHGGIPTTTALLERSVAGDADAFVALHRLHLLAIVGWMQRRNRLPGGHGGSRHRHRRTAARRPRAGGVLLIDPAAVRFVGSVAGQRCSAAAAILRVHTAGCPGAAPPRSRSPSRHVRDERQANGERHGR
jgi:hypothetical protein